MSDPFLLAAALLAKESLNQALLQAATHSSMGSTYHHREDGVGNFQRSPLASHHQRFNIQPETHLSFAEFSQPAASLPLSPRSGSQLYRQRLEALKVGKIYTRLPVDSFRDDWMNAIAKPSEAQWRQLLALEARAVARGQGNRRLAVMVGDSLSLWFPSDRLPSGQLWLNQSISGETTNGVLQRLSDFDETRPDIIYVMAGVNDLKQGASDNEILWNLRQIVRRLQRTHPGAQIVVQSILPTRSVQIQGERIGRLNRRLAAIAQQDGALYLDLFAYLSDATGNLRQDLTTDGIHLNANGYEIWQSVLWQANIAIARR